MQGLQVARIHVIIHTMSFYSKSGKPAWKSIGQAHKKKGRIQAGNVSSRQAKGHSASE